MINKNACENVKSGLFVACVAGVRKGREKGFWAQERRVREA